MKGQRGIFERPKDSGVWWIRYADTDGKERREKAGTKSTAKLLYQKRKQNALEGKKLPEKLRVKPISFNELLDDAVEHCKRHAKAGDTKQKSRRVDLIRQGLGTAPADTITPQQISRWLTKERHENDWKPATANRYQAFVSLAFRLGVENGKCVANPARSVRRLREENERIRFLSEAEEVSLRAAIAKLFAGRQADLDIALHTGMRQTEQYSLTWKDVDIDAKRLTVRHTKNGDKRHIPLNRIALSWFRLLRAESDGKGRVFMNARGRDPLRNPRYWWDKAVEEAGLVDFHYHDIRHTFSSRCIMAGVDLRTLQALLGHKTLQMVVRYTHLSQSHELAAVEKLCGIEVGTGTTTGTGTQGAGSDEEDEAS